MYEGFENNSTYAPYNMNDPNNVLILAKQNAGNIQVLKKQLDSLSELKPKVDDLIIRVEKLEKNVIDLMQQQKDYANQLTGGKELNIKGT
jgi:hypothetical protein